jgi:hypothetical protein
MNSKQTQPPRRWRRLARWLLPSPGSLLLIAALLWAGSAGALPLAYQAAPASPSTTTIGYQGRLADSDGVPIEGTVDLQFSLYATDTDPTPLWGPEIHTAVPVHDGLFSVSLGGPAGGLPLSLLGGDLWLEVTVAGETLSPRQRLGSVPYAMQALTVPDRAITSDKLAVTHWQVRDDAELIWQTEALDQFVPVPGIVFTHTATVDGVILVNVTAALQHSLPGAQAQCGMGVNGENPTARGAAYLVSPGREVSCSAQFAHPVVAGQTYQFELMVHNVTPGTLSVHKGEFTVLTAVLFGSP